MRWNAKGKVTLTAIVDMPLHLGRNATIADARDWIQANVPPLPAYRYWSERYVGDDDNAHMHTDVSVVSLEPGDPADCDCNACVRAEAIEEAVGLEHGEECPHCYGTVDTQDRYCKHCGLNLHEHERAERIATMQDHEPDNGPVAYTWEATSEERWPECDHEPDLDTARICKGQPDCAEVQCCKCHRWGTIGLDWDGSASFGYRESKPTCPFCKSEDTTSVVGLFSDIMGCQKCGRLFTAWENEAVQHEAPWRCPNCQGTNTFGAVMLGLWEYKCRDCKCEYNALHEPDEWAATHDDEDSRNRRKS